MRLLKLFLSILLIMLLTTVACKRDTSPEKPDIDAKIPSEVRDRIKLQADSLKSGSRREFILREKMAWIGLNEYANPVIPSAVITEKKAELARQFPDSFSSRLNILKKQMEDYLFITQFNDVRIPPGQLKSLLNDVRAEAPTDYSVQRATLVMKVENWLLMRSVE